MLPLPLIASLALAALQNERPEPPLGSRIPAPAYQEEHVDEAPRAEAFRVLQRLGECVVKADARRSMALLMTNPGTTERLPALDAVKALLPACLGTAAQGTALYGTLKLQLNETDVRGA